ncbi:MULTISPECIES: enoyl-ACP reductase FabI [Cupriavidus]|uniref:enoyl-ACP reductase FabI n=1 Tax=Cupriavidus sp. WS TaxID=1312922 RepID=UPI0003683036|nr:enoyl-ACP reductase FabI [Cupriavidus sp. WS]
MGFLDNKRILVTGVLSPRSIAYGIAAACRREGAELAFSYAGERFRQRIQDIAGEFGSELVFECDVASDAAIDGMLAALAARWGTLDGLVHAIGFAPREAISGGFLDGLSRESFRIAHDISAYSFPALAKAALPLLSPRASLLTLSYIGAQRAMPHYNVMGPAKASLEASVRYLAAALGARGTRVNAISAGPIRTLAAAGIKDFGLILEYVERTAALRRNVDIGEVGNVAAFLLSDLASGMTGQVTYVDAGFKAMACPPGE